MLLLEAGNIKKYYGDRLIIGFEDFKVYKGDKIGLIGQNGSGKTTLLNILAKEIEPDEGFVKQYCDLSYIRQFSQEEMKANPKALKEFNLSDKQDQEVFSGGEETRIKIANALSKEQLLLLADEPTANLDYKGIELLKQKISKAESFILISHDRDLLDCLCNKTLIIKEGSLNLYNGGYSFYKTQNEMEQQRAEQEYRNYVSEKTKLEEGIRNRQNRAKTVRKAPRRMGNSEARLHKREATEKQEKINNAANSLKTRLEKLEVKERPREESGIKLDFSLTNPPKNKILISAEKLSFSYGRMKLFDEAKFMVYKGLKTVLWGENGTGKTTLLNLINDEPRKDIFVVPKARIGYFHQGFENLEYNKSVLENVMKDSVQSQTVVRTILARLLIAGDDVFKNVGMLSGGERIKVSFAKLFVSNANVLLLDEPTNYLDMKSIEALENVLCDYEGTVLFVSHDSAFVNSVADKLLVVENQKIVEFTGTLGNYLASKKRTPMADNKETERMIVQMRMAEVANKLSSAPEAEKERLEEEYRCLMLQLK